MKIHRNICASQILNTNGQALVELALLLPVFLLFIIGSIEFGRGFYMKNKAINAAREGVRAAVVSSASDYQTSYAERVHSIMSPSSIKKLEITPASVPTIKGTPVTVSVSAKFTTIVPHFTWFQFSNISSVSANATMRYELL